MKAWRFGITYHKDGDHIVLCHVPFWVTLVERALDAKPIQYLVGYVPGAYGLFSKLIFWLDEKEDVILKIPATAEMLKKVAPDDEWLWGDEEGSDNADSGSSTG